MTTTEYERNVVLSSTEYDVVGTRPIRPDGADKVTGRAIYGADFKAAGLLHGKILRSPHAHAKIKSIDTSKAEALSGVIAVVTNKDIPNNDPPDTAMDQDVNDWRKNVLAADKALYKGHAIAAVAAISPHDAEEALSLIEVDYEVLGSVMTVQQAMASEAPILDEELRTDEGGKKDVSLTNVAEHFRKELGDVEEGFSQSDIVVEREFDTSTVHQGYIEPTNSSAFWSSDGRVHVWCSTQGSFNVRDEVSKVLNVPESLVKVTPTEIGGGFGGKIPSYIDSVCALLSKKSGRHVKIVMTRQEVFEATGPTPGSNIKIKVGSDKNGKIKAAQAYLAYEAGAFKGGVVGAGSQCVFAAYEIPNQLIDGYDVVVNKPKTQAYRAPGATNAAFAMESVVTEIAEKLSIDPLDMRLNNASKEGTRRADGPTFPRIGCEEVLQAMKDHPHYKTPLDGPNRGRGIAIGYWFNVGFESACTITVNPDGTISLLEGSTDIGGSRASISMQAAEVLGINAEDVRPTVGDTDSVGYTGVTGGSRVTYATGWAAFIAAEEVKDKLIARAALIWDVPTESVDMVKGTIKSKTDSKLSMTFKELAAELNNTGGPIIGSGALDAGGAGAGGGSFAGNIVDVEVDPETGKVSILRFTVVQDAGKAVHPSYVEGQMQGGSVQGIGWALNEEYYMNDAGNMTNASLLDYRMPTSLDLPMIDTAIVEVPSQGHPYGVRGVGEANIVPPPAAIAHAIQNATGVWMNKLPMNPVAVTKATRKTSE